MNSLKQFKIKGQRRQLCLKKRIYKKKNEKNKKKALTKKEVFDSIYLVDGKKLGKRTMKIEEEANAKKDKIKVVKQIKRLNEEFDPGSG